jgi:hypothetical protein
MQLSSQNITSDNLKDTLLDFLISKGDFDKDMKTEGTLLIINDISTLKKYENQEVGVFKFGTLTSHSCYHLFLKDKDDCTIVDMKQPYENIVSLLLEYFQGNPFYSKEDILVYIKRVTELYIKNQDAVPWKLDD